MTKNKGRVTSQPAGKAPPEAQIKGFLAKYLPTVAAEARAARKIMLARLPGSVEMVYDNYNALVFGYSPNERPSDAIFSLAIMPRWVTLCFLQGKGLPDPYKLLRGSGNVVRHVRLQAARDLNKPEITSLIQHALDRARVPMPGKGRVRTVIRSVSAKQRPRRPAQP